MIKYCCWAILLLFIVVSTLSGGRVWEKKLPVSGILYEKNIDGSSGAPLASVDVEFRNRQRGLNITIRTNIFGRYYALLPDADYEVIIHHDDYIHNQASYSCRSRTYSDAGTYKSYRPKQPRKTNSYSGDNYIPDPPLLYPEEAPGAPVVQIEVSSSTVQVNEPFTITVHASDDKGLAAIWWAAEVATEPELLKPSIFDCDGETEVSWSWEITVQTAGSIALSADAVDMEYSDDSSEQIHKASIARRNPVAFVKVIE